MSDSKVLPSSFSKDSFEDSESDEELRSSQDSSEHGAGNTPMMSLFANYYGIEDPAVNNDSSTMDSNRTIDDDKFDADSFVKNLLISESIEGITMKDAEMVHEIRTLDGEMQKLVYDNYNKFITATETIKEMKEDVFGMDNDMSSVRANMKNIVKASQNLDTIFEIKRLQVDKVVRIRRLLERLEFLSELPERLANMIENELYKDAVKLYNKTISVLTRHSHVLSFKKIKERTELMMQELTEKVIKLLDDPLLEVNKLTQHISVLRLMNAPKYRVFIKFITTHKIRSMKMITSFQNESLVHEKNSDLHHSIVSLARTFHQSFISSLLEMLKGINELYVKDDIQTLTPLRMDNNKGNIPIENEMQLVYELITTTFNELMDAYANELIKSYQLFNSKYLHYFHHTNNHTNNHNNHISFVKFHVEYNDNIQQQTNAESFALLITKLRLIHSTLPTLNDVNHHENDNENDVKQDEYETNRFNLEEEYHLWIMLTRQTVLDIVYLDKARVECISKLTLYDNTVKPSTSRGNNGTKDNKDHSYAFSKKFCKLILTETIQHYKEMRKICIQDYIRELYTKWIPTIHYLISTQDKLWEPTNGNDMNDVKILFSQHIFHMKDIYLILLQQCIHCMEESIKFLKPIYELYDTFDSNLHDFQVLCNSWLVEMINDMMVTMIEYCGNGLSLNLQEEEQLMVHEACQDITKELKWIRKEEGNSTILQNGLHVLIIAGLIRYFSNNLFSTLLETVLTNHEFVIITDFHPIEMHILSKFDLIFTRLIHIFVEENTSDLVNHTIISLHHDYYTSMGDIGGNKNELLVIPPTMINIVQHIDYFARLCYLLFMEIPPILKMNTNPNEMMRRNSTMMGGVRQSIVSSGGGNNLSLQLDIDRMFSQRVTIFDLITPAISSEMILGTLFKSILRALLEEIRPMSLTLKNYTLFQGYLLLIKQSSLCVLKDCSGIEGLTEQLSAILFSRFLDANDINAADTLESSQLQKIVNQAFFDMSNNSVLISRNR